MLSDHYALRYLVSFVYGYRYSTAEHPDTHDFDDAAATDLDTARLALAYYIREEDIDSSGRGREVLCICGRCGRKGHNSRTCDMPEGYDAG